MDHLCRVQSPQLGGESVLENTETNIRRRNRVFRCRLRRPYQSNRRGRSIGQLVRGKYTRNFFGAYLLMMWISTRALPMRVVVYDELEDASPAMRQAIDAMLDAGSRR